MFKSSRRLTLLAGFALCTLLLAGSTAWLAPAAHGQNPQDVRRVTASPNVINVIAGNPCPSRKLHPCDPPWFGPYTRFIFLVGIN